MCRNDPFALHPVFVNEYLCHCDNCINDRDDAVDKWLGTQSEREQRTRERLDSEGYYDDPVKWHETHSRGVAPLHRLP